jgi:hypothetical protein
VIRKNTISEADEDLHAEGITYYGYSTGQSNLSSGYMKENLPWIQSIKYDKGDRNSNSQEFYKALKHLKNKSQIINRFFFNYHRGSRQCYLIH